MGSFSTTVGADVPRVLTRAEADQARRRFYSLIGMARDDAMLPKQCPPGSVIVKRATSDSIAAPGPTVDLYKPATPARTDDPASDYCLDPSLYYLDPVELGAVVATYLDAKSAYDTAVGWRTPPPAGFKRIWDVGEEPMSGEGYFYMTLRPLIEVWKDRAREAVRTGNVAWKYVGYGNWLAAAPYFAPVVLIGVTADWEPWITRAAETGENPRALRAAAESVSLIAMPAHPFAGDLKHVTMAKTGEWTTDGSEAPPPARRGTVDPRSDAWWYDTPWGRERAILWVSPMLPAPGGWWPSKIVPLEERDVVLVEHPHHFVQGADVEATKTGMDVLDVSDAYPRRVTVAQVPARHVLVPDTSLSRGQTGIVRTADGWAGYFSYESRGSGFSLGDLVDNFVNTVERAGQAIGRMDLKTLESVAVTALAVAVAGPAGLALMGSEKPWRDASLLAAGTYFFGYSPLMRLAEAPAGYTVTGGLLEMGTGSPIQVGMTELAGTSMISLPNGLLVTAEDIGAAEAIFQKLSLLAPEQAQTLLEKIASEGAYIDLIFTRLVVEAEKNEERRERLLAEFSAKQAIFWQNYGRWIAAALGAIVTVLTLGTAAEGAAFLYGLLEMLYTAGVTVQNLEVQARAAREQERAMERELAEIDAEIARLEAEEEAALRAEEEARLAPAGASAEPQRSGVPWWLGLLFLLGGK